MVTYDEINTQNDKITELSNVLSYLLADRAMCDTQVTCDLFFEYVDQVKEHMELSDKRLCGKLLVHADRQVTNTAKNFLSGSIEIKRIMSDYLKKWCAKGRHELRIKDYNEFRKDTEEVFELVLNRIQNETEKLYPLLREITGDTRKVA